MLLPTYLAIFQITRQLTAMMATKCSLPTNVVPCKRLVAVNGSDVRKNDVIVCGNPRTSTSHIIYFGGDVQDYKEKMCINNPAYDYWDLETTARIIQSKFPNSCVFVVKPYEMFLNTFSTYRNFLHFDEEARPDFTSIVGGIAHLKALYNNANKLITENTEANSEGQKMDNNSPESSSITVSDKPAISLIGFSKGCVVINQLMFELKCYRAVREEFLDRISNIYWLDGGHTGGKNAYITDEDTLRDVVALKSKLFVHVTPYQIDDPMRAWIGVEETWFVDMLGKLGANITERKHFMAEPGSILNHFKVLTVF